MPITIVGLGPGDAKLLTREAWELLQSSEQLYLRTRRHPVVRDLPSQLVVHDFDAIYEREHDFSAVYEAICREVIALGQQPEGVIYAVPGHPLVAESSVVRIIAAAEAAGIPVRIVEGLSFIEPTLTLLKVDAIEGLQVADATEIAAQAHPPLNPDRPALISQLHSRTVAADVKLTLMNQYPDEHPVTLAHAAGMAAASARTVALFELDLQDGIDELTSLYVPPLPRISSIEAFHDTVARLRAPNGCPWDRDQTHLSLRPYLLEETYEVLSALDAEDPDKLVEEMGDLLMQILIHSQIATEEGDFRFSDVVAFVDNKIKRRHPHVFGTQTVSGSDEVLRNWEEIKRHERGEKDHQGMLSGVPTALPALSVADSYQRRVVRVGFDWPNIQGVIDKVAEEVEEIKQAPDAQTRAREMGDLLFALVNFARWLDIDSESALRETNARFARRFSGMERLARERGLRLQDLSLEEQDRLWQEIKETDG